MSLNDKHSRESRRHHPVDYDIREKAYSDKNIMDFVAGRDDLVSKLADGLRKSGR